MDHSSKCKPLLDSVDLPIVRSLKHGVVDCESDSMRGKSQNKLRAIKEQ